MTQRIVTELNPNLQKLEDGYGKEFSSVNELTKGLSLKAAVGEELLLMEALQEHLGRLITTDDFKTCQMMFVAGKPNQYIFCYDGQPLGLVKKIIKFGALNVEDYRDNKYSIQYEVSFLPIRANTSPSASPLSVQ